MSKTMLNIKTDTKVKAAAQKLAREIGVPLSTIINAQLKSFLRERRVELVAPLIPNARTKKILNEVESEWKKSASHGPFANAEEMLKSLGI